MSIEDTLAERGNRYGDFADHARICQQLKDVMKFAQVGGSRVEAAAYVWDHLPHIHKQALEVIADKIARILSGDPDYADNWHDIQGYAKLVEDRLPKSAEPAPLSPREAALMAEAHAAGYCTDGMSSAKVGHAAPLPIDPDDVDITDGIPPELWAAGDAVECLENHSGQFTKGRLYVLARDSTPRTASVVADDTGISNGWAARNFRFHSRPTK